ncbi:hypothetical protein U1Q18_022477 [Sarracenia purpurea var. burkii]
MRRKQIILLMVILLVLLVRGESKASLIRTFLRFAKVYNPNHKALEMAPSSSPVPSIRFNSRGAGGDNLGGNRDGNNDDQMRSTSPKAEPIDSITDERCDISSLKWCRDLKKMTACLLNSESGRPESFLIVQNEEDNLLKVKWAFFPKNITLEAIELQKHQAKKINISANVGGSRSIILNAGNGECVIPIGPPFLEDNSTKQIPYGGVCLMALVVLVFGGALAFFKLRKRGRHLDGLPYRELEMGELESGLTLNVEAVEGWDEDWDDDWDEEKAVKSLDRKQLKNGHANGVASWSSIGDGRETIGLGG